jgi:hypothetical protein
MEKNQAHPNHKEKAPWDHSRVVVKGKEGIISLGNMNRIDGRRSQEVEP